MTASVARESSASLGKVNNRLSFRPYSKYYNSEVEWLGDIPVGWNTQPMCSIARESKLSNAGMVEGNLLSLSYGKIKRKDIDSLGGLLPESFETYQVVNKNDVIFRLTDLQNDKRSLRTALCPERGIITSAYVAVTPTKIEPYYFAYLMRAYDELKVFYNLGSGMRQSLKYDELKRLPIVLPPNDLQQIIVAFLDRETARIDNLIAEKLSFVDLLKENCRALISHVITKGLDPKVKMKESGIEWIGEVPEHWKITKLGRLIFMQEGPGLRTWQFTEDGTRVICVTNITENGIDFERLSKFISNEEYAEKYKHFTVRAGDLLISSSGNSWGKVARYTGQEDVILNTSTIRVNELSPPKLLNGFVEFLLQSDLCREQLGLSMTGACQPNFGPSHLKEVVSVFPSQEEQAEIQAYLKRESEKFANIVREAENSIALLQEHRTALISAAVTGKIDVRDLQ